MGHAAPLDVSDVPLELTPSVAPNVLFLNNDSGSMDWEVLTEDAINGGKFNSPQPDGTGLPTQITQREPQGDNGADANCLAISSAFGGYAYAVAFATNTDIPATAGSENCFVAADDAWRFRNYQFNPFYFDPNKTYEPWAGTDSNGDSFEDADIQNAPDNPFNPQNFIDLTLHKSGLDVNGNRINGVGFKYFIWNDANNNGLFEDGEEMEFLIRDQDADTQQNFANWFTYHRSREFEAKAITGALVASNSSARIGYSTINQNAGIGLPVEMLNQDPSTGDKKALLDVIYQTNSIGGSPLRTSYEKVGRYFECLSGDIFNSTTNSSPGDTECPVVAPPAGACQRNSAIVITDSTYDGIAPTVGNTDGDNNTNFDGGAFADSFSNTFADVAMDYYERDLHNSLVDDVPVTNIDLNRDPSSPLLQAGDKLHQHLESNVIGLGLQVLGQVSAYPSDPSVPFTWPDPTLSMDGIADDLLHATYNGRGEYFTTKDVTQLQDDVQAVFNRATTNESSTTSVAFNTQNITEETLVFRTFSNLASNTGELAAQRVNTDGTFNQDASGNPIFEWSAATELSNISTLSRLILTYSSEAATRGGRVFDLGPTNGLTASQASELEQPIPANVNPPSAISSTRVSYLRGDKNDEGISFDDGDMRIRPPVTTTAENIATGGLIGDIVHSSPVFVGEPPFAGRFGGAFPRTAGDTYSEFRNANRNREQLVYVGANDGMLHAFKVADGVEKFAYVPDVLLKDIGSYTNPDYSHRFYVDATPSINDAYILPTSTATNREWRTVLVNGLGAGGKGYFALDITDPANFDTSIVMWEFTEEDDGTTGNSDLGLTFSRPLIAMSNAAASGDQKWVAIFGNGFNSTSVDGNAVIYILFIEEGFDGWSSGDFIKIDTGIGKSTSIDGSTPNGISALRGIDVDGNGTVDRLYSGDLQGNVYVTDISDSNSANWDASSNTKVLFEAKYSPGFPRTTPQPITNRPTVIENPDADGFIVVVGTGSYFTKEDASSTEIQSLYGLWDDLLGTNLPIEMNSTTSELVEQVFTTSIDTITGLEVRTTTNNVVQYNNTGSNQVRGWYIDFDIPPPGGSAPDVQFPGERAVRDLQIRSAQLFTNTVIPQDGTSCAPPPGGFGISVDPVTGGSGINVIFDVNIDGVFDADDNLNQVDSISNIITGTRFESTPSDSTFVGDYRVTQLADRTIDRILVNPDLNEGGGLSALLGRHSWKEILFD